MNVAYALAVLKRHVITLITTLLVGLAAGGAYAVLSHSLRTTTAFSIEPVSESAAQSLYLASPERFAKSQSQVLLSDDVIGGAAARLEPSTSASEIWDSISLSGGDVDNVFELHTVTASAEQGREMATAVIEEFEAASAGQTQVTLLRVGPALSTHPVDRYLVLGGGAALGLVMIAILIVTQIRRPVLGWQQLLELTDEVSPGAKVFPGTLHLGESRSDSERSVTRWLRLLAKESPSVIAVVPASDSQASLTDSFISKMQDGTGSTRLVDLDTALAGDEILLDAAVVLASLGAANERDVRSGLDTAAALAPRSGVVVLHGRHVNGQARGRE